MGDRSSAAVPFMGGLVVGAGIMTGLILLFGQGNQSKEKPPPPVKRKVVKYHSLYKCTCEEEEGRLVSILIAFIIILLSRRYA